MVDTNQLLATFIASVLVCVMLSQFTLAGDNVAKCDTNSPRKFYLNGTRGGLEATSAFRTSFLMCQWTIIVPDKKRVKLTFTKFDVGRTMKNQGSACSSYVEVVGGRALGRYCGFTAPAPLYSTESTMMVTFFVIDVYHISRIKADFEAVDKDPVGMRVVGLCLKSNPTYKNKNIQLEMPSGRIQTPNYPSFYLPSMVCTWKITVSKGKRIKLSFESFKLYYSITRDKIWPCRPGPTFDYLLVKDGVTKNSSSLGIYCKGLMPAPIYSSGRHMLVSFHSALESLAFATGFRARFQEVKKDPVIMAIYGRCLASNPESVNRNLRINASSGRFESPNYPLLYPYPMKCIWKISVPEGKKIKLSFESFNVGYSFCREEGNFAHVTAKETNGESRYFCGNRIPKAFISLENTLEVVFHSGDINLDNTGFRARFKAVDPVNMTLYDRCLASNLDSVNKNLRINASSGRFESPNYPLIYPYPMKCIWKISVPEGKKVKLSFESFDVGYSFCVGEGNFAHVTAKETNGESKTFCGNRIPKAYFSSGNTLKVVFYTGNINLHYTGFRARFEAVERKLYPLSQKLRDPKGLFI